MNTCKHQVNMDYRVLLSTQQPVLALLMINASVDMNSTCIDVALIFFQPVYTEVLIKRI